MLARRVAICAAATVALLWLAPATVAQIRFGANLNRPANANLDCTVMLLPDASGRPTIGFPSNATTCTSFTTGTVFNLAESMLVPTGFGTVVRVRVRVGPVTGPMQIVVLRGVRDPNSRNFPACCRQVGQTRAFVPAAQAVTTLNTALRVKADRVPNPFSGAVDFDVLGLSVLAPGVPVPAHDTGNYDPLTAPVGQTYYPATAPGQERADGAGTVGFQTLVNADWVAGFANAGAGQISLIQRAISVTRGNTIISLACNQARPCVGFVRLGPSAIAGRRARRPSYGGRRFRIRPHRVKRVRVPLNRGGRGLLRRRRQTKVAVIAELRGKRVLAMRATLRR